MNYQIDLNVFKKRVNVGLKMVDHGRNSYVMEDLIFFNTMWRAGAIQLVYMRCTIVHVRL